MPLEISDEEVIRLAAKLAALTGLTETEAVKRALAMQGRRARNAARSSADESYRLCHYFGIACSTPPAPPRGRHDRAGATR